MCLAADTHFDEATTLMCLTASPAPGPKRVLSSAPFVRAEDDWSDVLDPLERDACHRLSAVVACTALDLEDEGAVAFCAGELEVLRDKPITYGCVAACARRDEVCARACAPECG